MISVAIGAFILPTPTEAARPEAVAHKSIESRGVIRTKDPEKARTVIREAGLRELVTTPLPNGEAFITIETQSTRLESLQVQLHDHNLEIQPNYQYQPLLTPNDPLFGQQWNLLKISTPSAWNTTNGSQDATIAVIDSGVLFSQGWQDSPDCPSSTPCTQPDFPESKKWTNSGEVGSTTQEGSTPNCTSQGLTLDKSCNNLDDDSNGFVDDWQGWDFMGGWRGDSATCPNHNSPTTYQNPTYPDYIDYDNDPQPYSCDSPTDENALNRDHYDGTCIAWTSACYVSHGTAVASVAASASNNSELVAGVDWNAKIMPLRALDGYGWGSSIQVAAAIEYATAAGADVINLSLALFSNGSCTTTDSLVESALEEAASAGVIVVAASGNTGTSGVCYPARSSNAIAVGATDSSDKRAGFSTYGPELDIVAPGVGVPAALAPNKASNYATYSLNTNGTSFATPHAAGLASLLLDEYPDLTPSEVRTSLIENAYKVAGMNGNNRTDTYGYGRINAYYTVEQANHLDYEPMVAPRKMHLTLDTPKTDLLSLQDIDSSIANGSILSFTSKIKIDEITYLRTAYDTKHNLHKGIPLAELSELPKYEAMSQPRSMALIASQEKTNFLTKDPIGGILPQYHSLQFDTKTYIDGQLYLRSKYDTKHGLHRGILYSQLRNTPAYVSLDTPREMRLKESTRKIDLLLFTDVGNLLSEGQMIRFETKTLINRQWYLRSKYDTDNRNHLGIPLSKVEL
jgi:subtilisin family serine protease